MTISDQQIQASLRRSRGSKVAQHKADRQKAVESVAAYHWFVAVVVPGQEKKAVDELTAMDIASLLPVAQFWRRNTRYQKKKTLKSYPLMPGYVFVGVRSLDELSEIWVLDVIRGFICMDGKACQVPLFQVERLAARVQSYIPPDAHRFMRTHKEFGVGDEVEVLEGPLTGRIVRVMEIHGNRARILWDILGKAHNVELTLDTLVPV